MARQSEYSEQEDVILLATAGLSRTETNEQLVAAGFLPRSAASIKNRRYYLSKNPPFARDEVSMLVQRRQRILTEIEALDKRRERLRGQLESINRELHQQLEQQLAVEHD